MFVSVRKSTVRMTTLNMIPAENECLKPLDGILQVPCERVSSRDENDLKRFCSEIKLCVYHVF